jgi:glucokinase
MASWAAGVDIGGTKIAIGIVDDQGHVAAKETLKTNTQSLPCEITEHICHTIENLTGSVGLTLADLKGIGIGAPGPLDPKNGRITCPPNLPTWTDFPLVKEMQIHLSLPVVLENDATAATLAEKWIGAARDSDNFLFITISTGIGAGLFVNGKLFTGASGNAGDIGHIVIDPSAGTCICGQKGCFEYIASGTAIARRASEGAGKPLTAKEVFELYEQGDPLMTDLVEETFTYIGMGCVSMINAFDPEKIVIGGGVSQVGKPLFEAVQSYVSQYALNPTGRKTQIVPAFLLQDAGLIGAAALIHIGSRK